MFSEGEDKHTVLQAAAMGTKWWEPARDALDTMVLNAAALHELEGYQHTAFMPFDPSIKVSAQFLPSRNNTQGPVSFKDAASCDTLQSGYDHHRMLHV